MRIIAQQSRQQKRKLRRLIQKERDAGTKTRLSIILHLAESQKPAAVARALHIARSTVYRVAERFRDGGLAGLADRREDNGGPLVDDAVLLELRAIVAQRPAHFGWPRPTWTQEMLALTLQRQTGARLSRQTIGRCLQALGARHGRPRPVLRCPWKKAAQMRRIRALQRLLATLPKDEVAFYADEVDIHLNPKIGPDWMLPGQQKVVVTPGQNVKRYLAGALDTRSGQLLWVADRHKRSGLFIDLARHVVRRHPNARCIHLIVDNYSIHSSRQTRLALAELPQVRLHYLPPYSPDFNPIEREWRLLHAEVTRNHCCATIDELMEQVRRHLAYRNRVKGLRYKRVA
jgi:transposase